jgi:hypothetical protein
MVFHPWNNQSHYISKRPGYVRLSWLLLIEFFSRGGHKIDGAASAAAQESYPHQGAVVKKEPQKGFL